MSRPHSLPLSPHKPPCPGPHDKASPGGCQACASQLPFFQRRQVLRVGGDTTALPPQPRPGPSAGPWDQGGGGETVPNLVLEAPRTLALSSGRGCGTTGTGLAQKPREAEPLAVTQRVWLASKAVVPTPFAEGALGCLSPRRPHPVASTCWAGLRWELGVPGGAASQQGRKTRTVKSRAISMGRQHLQELCLCLAVVGGKVSRSKE